MSENILYECPDCGNSVKEADTKCAVCGAEFEGDTEDKLEESVGTSTPEIKPEEKEDENHEQVDVKSEGTGGTKTKEQEEIEVVGVDEEKADTEKGEKDENGEKAEEKKEGPILLQAKKTRMNIGRTIIPVIGAIGVIGAVLLDPILNLLDSKHSATINIGPFQMAGILGAVLISIVGIVITLVMRRKGE